MVIQILVTVFSALLIIKTAKQVRRKSIGMAQAFLWILLWIGMIVVVWRPEITDTIAHFLQVGRGADALFYLSLILTFYLFYKLFVRIDHLDSEVTTLIREIAILEKERKE